MALGEAGGVLPGFKLEFRPRTAAEEEQDIGPKTMDWRLTSYLVVTDARYGDNFMVAAHPHDGIEETYEFRENEEEELILKHPENSGVWEDLPSAMQTAVLTILPSVDIDCDSDNTEEIERSDWEEKIENEADYLGKIVAFNSDDDNENDVPDYLENADYGYPGGGSWVPFEDDDLVQVVLDRGFEDLTGMDDTQDPDVFFVFELKVTVDRGLKYWLDREKTPIDETVYDEIETFTEAGNPKVIYRWIVSAGDVGYPPSIYVEGVDQDALTDTLIWRVQKVTVSGSERTYELIHEDTVKITDPAGGNLTAYRPLTEADEYGHPFARHEVDEFLEQLAGAGIRRNGDDDNGNEMPDREQLGQVENENDLVELKVEISRQSAGHTYILKRSNGNIRVFSDKWKTGWILVGGDTETDITTWLSNEQATFWVEWINMDSGASESFVELYQRTAGRDDVLLDRIRFYPFNSIVIALSGEDLGSGQANPTDPASEDAGPFQIAISLYEAGYDVHMYNEDEVNSSGRGAVYDEIKEAVGERGVTNIVAFGHSHGGGSVEDLIAAIVANTGIDPNTHAFTKPYTVAFTGYIDAINNDPAHAFEPETNMPANSQYHVNIYQNTGAKVQGLHGVTIPGSQLNLNVRYTAWGHLLTHTDIDQNIEVKRLILNHLTEKAKVPK